MGEGRRHRGAEAPGRPLITGQAVGERIATGRVRVVRDLTELQHVDTGDVLVAINTDPDWEPAMKRVAAIVTEQGGRTAHAAIVSRELGLPCIVGTGTATHVLKTGDRKVPRAAPRSRSGGAWVTRTRVASSSAG